MSNKWDNQDLDDWSHPTQYDRLSDDQKQLLQDWISDRIKPSSAYLYLHTSYGLKHSFEHDTGLYIPNGAFKGAMLAAGYTPNKEDEVNPSYKMRPLRRARSKKMRMIQRQRGWWAIERRIQIVYDVPGGRGRLENSLNI